MKKFIVCAILGATGLCADEVNKPTIVCELAQGYRHDSLRIKYAHNEKVHGSDRFKDVDVYSSRLSMSVSKDAYFLKGIIGYGNVYDGKFRRHVERKFFHHNVHMSLASHLTGDYTADFALIFGKEFALCRGWSMQPRIGYGVYLQKFHTGRTKSSTSFGKQHTKERGSRERIKATWYSPEVGMSLNKAFTAVFSTYGSYAFLFPLNYHARCHGGSEQYDQENRAYKSFGHIAMLGIEWKFAKGWSLKPEVEQMLFYSRGGDADHHFNLRKVRRTATEVRLVLGYSF